MAAATVASPVSALRDDHVMDTRTPSPVQRPPAERDSEDAGANSSADEAYQPDLSQEVAMLSTKLVNAINYQTNLDDSLQATRHELDKAQQELARVRAEKQSLDDAIAQGVLMKKSAVDQVIAELRADLAKEKASRESAERAKRETDGELENLTANLFEEANKMVAAARRDTDAVEKRNSQLKNQIKDTEVLLASQQEQLQDLKLNMERQSERTDSAALRDSSVPTTPINSASAVFDAVYASPNKADQTADIPPDQPLHFTYLLQPVLRDDVAAYTDFAELLNWARWARQSNLPHSRNASGNMTSASQTNLSSTSASAASMSSPNLPGAFSFGTNSANSSPSTSSAASFTPPLKESKFYKRSLIEDLEPTLRLDLAPGLSFLSRRTVNSALLNGTLTIEPFSPPTKFYSPIFACALCGEARKTEPYIRRHRFRTSESEDASRYPLCAYCLERVRASADFVGFLRMVRDGHWRCGSEEEGRAAWEESVRLRERCFWARVGGGVVPAATAAMAGERRGTEVENKSEDEVGKESEKGMEGNVEGQAQAQAEVAAEKAPAARDSEDDIARASIQAAEAEAATEAESGIGRAIVNMASRAASNSVPKLQPHRDSSASSTVRDVPDADADVLTPAKEAILALEPHGQQEQPSSQQDQADADAQLQREASGVTEMERREMATPPETPQPHSRTDSSSTVSDPAPATDPEPEASQPAAASEPESAAPEPAPAPLVSSPERPRSTSRASLQRTSTRTPSPQKRASRAESPATTTAALRPAQEERRPSSASSVLARVRAMEGRGK